MKLTEYTDYTLRTLIYLGLHWQPAQGGEELVTIAAIAEAYGISRNHLMKIVNHLARLGLVDTLRGRSGGLRLARPPAAISIGAVVREAEQAFCLVECLSPGEGRCALTPVCRLRGLFETAMEGFFQVLDRHSLADILENGSMLRPLLQLPEVSAPIRS